MRDGPWRLRLRAGCALSALGVAACAVAQNTGDLTSYEVNSVVVFAARLDDGDMVVHAALGTGRTFTCPVLDSHVGALLNGRAADSLAPGDLADTKLGTSCHQAVATWTLTSTDVDVFSPSLHIEFVDSNKRVTFDAEGYFLYRNDGCDVPCGDLVPSHGPLATLAQGSELTFTTESPTPLTQATAMLEPALPDGGVLYVPDARHLIQGDVSGTGLTLVVPDIAQLGASSLTVNASAQLKNVVCSPAGIQCGVPIAFMNRFVASVVAP